MAKDDPTKSLRKTKDQDNYVAEELSRLERKPFDELDSNQIAKYIGLYVSAYSTARSITEITAQSSYKYATPASNALLKELAMTLRDQVATIEKTVPSLIIVNVRAKPTLSSLESLATNTLLNIKQ